MRAIKHTMALITESIGCTKCAPAQMPWHLRHPNPALLNRQGMSTHPKMENGSEHCFTQSHITDHQKCDRGLLLPLRDICLASDAARFNDVAEQIDMSVTSYNCCACLSKVREQFQIIVHVVPTHTRIVKGEEISLRLYSQQRPKDEFV